MTGAADELAGVAGPFSAKLSDLLQAAGSDQTQRRRLVGALTSLAKSHAGAMDAQGLLKVVSPLVGMSDLQLSAKVLQLCGNLLGATPALGVDLKAQVWPGAFAILNNPALNESARECIQVTPEAIRRCASDF